MVVNDELSALDRAADVDAKLETLGRRVVHRRLENPEATLAGTLRAVHGDVRRTQHGRGGWERG